MARYRVKTNSRLLADIVLSPRSSAYKELCAMCTDEKGFQSDEAAARLRDELKLLLADLLNARNLDAINKKLADAPAASPLVIRVRVSDPTTHVPANEIKVGKHRLFLRRTLVGTTAEQLVYDVLRRALESRDINRLALCECEKLFYRQPLKRSFCSDICRWEYHN